MVKNSTSSHRLNADKGLNVFQKLFYLLSNAINNSFPYSRLDPNLKIRDLRYSDLELIWKDIERKSSPSRKLCDLFWKTLPWEAIEKELGGLHALDIGCGRGDYAIKLMEWSGNRIMSYTGWDAFQNDHWETVQKEYPHFQFSKKFASDIEPDIPEGTNFFMTQSAIEHFDEDLAFFKQINRFVKSQNYPILQVHVFPSRACLPLYFAHGVRQYTPRNVSKITRLFKDSECVLFGLGGKNCRRVHFNYITKPLYFQKTKDKRETHTELYEQDVFEAVRQDMTKPQKNPAFHALIIHSHPKQKLFN